MVDLFLAITLESQYIRCPMKKDLIRRRVPQRQVVEYAPFE